MNDIILFYFTNVSISIHAATIIISIKYTQYVMLKYLNSVIHLSSQCVLSKLGYNQWLCLGSLSGKDTFGYKQQSRLITIRKPKMLLILNVHIKCLPTLKVYTWHYISLSCQIHCKLFFFNFLLHCYSDTGSQTRWAACCSSKACEHRGCRITQDFHFCPRLQVSHFMHLIFLWPEIYRSWEA